MSNRISHQNKSEAASGRASFIAGLLAQPALQADVGKTLRFAVWQHGRAADALQASRPNWVVEDLVAELGN